jgi:hypothetical protein
VSRLLSDPPLPGPHPDPPADLAGRALPIETAIGEWVRIHQRGRAPLFFGTTGAGRFDAPAGEFGVLYIARQPRGSFVETLLRDLSLHTLSWGDLERRLLTQLRVLRPLRLVDLRGPGLRQLGADSRLWTGEYTISRRWALALHDHPDRPDGILYSSRYDPSQACAAIFERARSAIAADDSVCLADPDQIELLDDLLDAYRIELIRD